MSDPSGELGQVNPAFTVPIELREELGKVGSALGVAGSQELVFNQGLHELHSKSQNFSYFRTKNVKNT